jgi:hypothetical protein
MNWSEVATLENSEYITRNPVLLTSLLLEVRQDALLDPVTVVREVRIDFVVETGKMSSTQLSCESQKLIRKKSKTYTRQHKSFRVSRYSNSSEIS